MQRWFYLKSGKTQGPEESGEIKLLLETRKLGPLDLVCADGDAEWRPIAEVSEFQPVLENLPEANNEDAWVVLTKKSKKRRQIGPFEAEEVRSMIKSGAIRYTDYIWKQGMSEWYKVAQVPEFNPDGQFNDGKTDNVILDFGESREDYLKSVMRKPHRSMPQEEIPEEVQGPELVNHFQERGDIPQVESRKPPKPPVMLEVHKRDYTPYGLIVFLRMHRPKIWSGFGVVVIGVGMWWIDPPVGKWKAQTKKWYQEASKKVFPTLAETQKEPPPRAEPPKQQVIDSQPAVSSNQNSPVKQVANNESNAVPQPKAVSEKVQKPDLQPRKLPTYIKTMFYQLKGKNPRVVISSNGSKHYPIVAYIHGRGGQNLGVKGYFRKIKLKAGKGSQEIFLKDLRLLNGSYKMSVVSGDIEREYDFFLGSKNKKYVQNLWRKRKEQSYSYQQEKRSLLVVAKALNDLSEKAAQPTSSVPQKRVNQWRKKLRQIRSRHLNQPSSSGRQKVYHPMVWKQAFELKRELGNQIAKLAQSGPNVSKISGTRQQIKKFYAEVVRLSLWR